MSDKNFSPIEREIIFYQTDDGNQKVNVLYQNETFWLTQKGIAELFGVGTAAINKHLKNIYEDNELSDSSTISKMEIVQKEGTRSVSRLVSFYNLDAIIAVGYRVNSVKATRFRIWATNTLKEYIIKGFVLNDDLLKNGRSMGKDYFDELLERVRSIRASERRIYQKITDIFAECSLDYDPQSTVTRNFYAMVQNKFHYAITGQTAAEIIYNTADHSKPNMGLTTWKNSPDGRILKSDVTVAKNYLSENQIRTLERTVSGFFDYIELVLERHQAFTMEEFANSVDKFLSFNEFEVLKGKGRISMSAAEAKAREEYLKFNKTQKIHSDFDKFIENVKNVSKK